MNNSFYSKDENGKQIFNTHGGQASQGYWHRGDGTRIVWSVSVGGSKPYKTPTEVCPNEGFKSRGPRYIQSPIRSVWDYFYGERFSPQ